MIYIFFPQTFLPSHSGLFILSLGCNSFFLLFFFWSGTSFPSTLKKNLLKLGVPKEVVGFLFGWVDGPREILTIPEAKGSIKAIRSEAFFIPLYELYLTYGGIFRLTFGPKVGFVLLCLYLLKC